MTVNSNVSKNSASVDQQTIQDLSSTGRHQECLEACQKLLQSEAESPMAWKYAGKSLIALGQMENAQQCLKKAHQIAKSDPEIAKDIGNIFLILGRREDATAWYRKSLEIKNDYVPAIVKLANIKKQSGNNQEAANLYNQAIQTDPTLVEAYVGAAACTMALGNLDQAQTIATQAIGINQSIEGVNEILGVIYQNKRNFQQAIASYQKELDINPKSETSLLNLGLLLLQQGESAAAIKPLTRAAAINPSEQCSLLLAQAYQSVGNQKEAICEYQKIDFSKIQNKMIPFNLGLCLLNTGRNIDAIEAFKIAIKLDESFLPAWGNIGTAFMKEGRYQEALPVTQKVIEHDPNNPTAHMNLGGIYKDLGNLDQALASTLKSLELNPANPDALNNLSCIYQDLGNLDQAFASTLKSLELKDDNPGAINNLKGLIRRPNLSKVKARNLTRAYESLLNRRDISHHYLLTIFSQAFLPIIQKASKSDPIISDGNEALGALAADWRFLKSLTLMILPSSEAERFFTRIRKELLYVAIQDGSIPEKLKCLTESLAAQCHLNEYVYTSSPEEDEHASKLIEAAIHNQTATNRYLAIIGCYKAIHTTGISPEFIKNYPRSDDSSKELITTQFMEPRQEQELKTSFQEKQNIDDSISQKVQEMYEQNPYPRFKFADYTNRNIANTTHKSIEIEATRKKLYFSDELKTSTAEPKVLIAGCGTGYQIIVSSRYKNADITAIDLSSSSLAYAKRKCMEYGMKNVKFKKMDLLNVSTLGDVFDIIECCGVLHHMEKPSKGLSALIHQLKPSGYIRLGLYSELSRKVIKKARKTIQTLGIDSTPEGIRKFRKQVLDGQLQDLLALTKFGRDFYSLSECRDLCFHVQEHRFTTELLQKLLDSHGLTFCGFIVPDQIKELFQEKYPEDNNMISLTNWGEFEEEYPSTFAGMYQFWAQK